MGFSSKNTAGTSEGWRAWGCGFLPLRFQRLGLPLQLMFSFSPQPASPDAVTEAQGAPWGGRTGPWGAGGVALGAVTAACAHLAFTSSLSIHFLASDKVCALSGSWGGHSRPVVAADNCAAVSSVRVLRAAGARRLGRLLRRSSSRLPCSEIPVEKEVSAHCFLVKKGLVGLANIY